MGGENNLKNAIGQMTPELNDGAFVFVCVRDKSVIKEEWILGQFREHEGITVIVEKSVADKLGLKYDYIAAWISLRVHSALNLIGLTAAVSTELAKNNISCNVVAAYYHDHIFVKHNDAHKAMKLLNALSDR